MFKAAALLLAGGSLIAGCANGSKVIELDARPVNRETLARIEPRTAAIRCDPLAYLREVAANCRALEQYTLTFTRYERRGLFPRMQGPEHIAAWFRREPFSVRLKWLDDDIKYGETVYVANQADDQVRFVTRWWTPPLRPPPAVNRVNLPTPVFWGESKRPLTEFGLERLMDHTLDAIEQAGPDAVVRFEETTILPLDGRPVHHIRIELPPARSQTPTQDLYIDVATDLPAGAVVRLRSGRIDAAYFYADIDAEIELTDDDFLLPAERAAAEQTAGP